MRRNRVIVLYGADYASFIYFRSHDVILIYHFLGRRINALAISIAAHCAFFATIFILATVQAGSLTAKIPWVGICRQPGTILAVLC